MVYKNPGKVLKLVATIQFILGCVVSFIAAIVSAVLPYTLLDKAVGLSIFLFILVIVVGVVVSYIGAIYLACLGEVIQSMTKMASSSDSIKKSLESIAGKSGSIENKTE